MFKLTPNLWFFLFLLFNQILSFGQEQQGNIVEYFGKEKVDSIGEGELVHIFKEGYILPGNRFRLSSSTVPDHTVFAHFIFDKNPTIYEGKTEITGSGDTTVWESIRVSEHNQFSDARLRSGHLYLSYQSPREQTLLFEASGHTQAVINGLPYEGDHYDFGYSLIPVKLKKGQNHIVMNAGRHPRMRARMIKPKSMVQLTTRDMTLPDILQEEEDPFWGAIRIINSEEDWFANGSIDCTIGSQSISTDIPNISPRNVRKVKFQIPNSSKIGNQEYLEAIVTLISNNDQILDQKKIRLSIKSIYKHHKRTFISEIDGSVQYYAVAPASNPDIKNPAMILSVHGASVEATNQVNAYKQKAWGHIVAPTNRRPYGFAWEDWGRLDAMEVLDHTAQLFGTDPNRTYLTGHSMGGHGTWYLGATYPDKWAAIAPCAGYPEREAYVNSFRDRMKQMSDDELKRLGLTRLQLDRILSPKDISAVDQVFESYLSRASNPVKTLKLIRNYLHYGVFIYHGEKDNVVPTYLAQDMRKRLGEFHHDFSYYEYPEGTHWFGDESMDWPPLFDFLKDRSRPASQEIRNMEFYTASPGVSSTAHFIQIIQQKTPLEISSILFTRENGLSLTTQNVSCMDISIDRMGEGNTLIVDNQSFNIVGRSKLLLENDGKEWIESSRPSFKEKGPHRNGGFKDAFRNNVIFVYGTAGTEEENIWMFNKARLDAQTFYYRANGSIELVKDRDFSPDDYADRNIILYGNKDNNTAWNAILKHCPIQVSENKVTMGYKTLSGQDWGSYFIYPRSDSDIASIGVITGSGLDGMKSAFANHYFQNSTHFPDVLIFNGAILNIGLKGIHCTGFFGNDWSINKGDFVWR